MSYENDPLGTADTNRKEHLLDMHLDRSESILAGDSVFAETSWEYLQTYISGIENEASNDIQEIIDQLPPAEVTNMLHRASEIAKEGDVALAKVWLSTAKTSMAYWSEKGALNSTQQEELDEKHRSLMVEILNSKSGEVLDTEPELPDEPSDVKELRMFTSLGEEISAGKRIFADTIFGRLQELHEVTDEYSDDEDVFLLRGQAEHLLKTLPIDEMNNMFGKVDELLVGSNKSLALQWLDATKNHLEKWGEKELLNESNQKAFNARLLKLLHQTTELS